jgi:predicted RNase H-like HicB family nuclease
MSDVQSADVPAYVVIVERQETTDGEYCYLAYHPEIPNCFGQGSTPKEAEESLADATTMVMEHLRASALPIPQPQVSRLAFGRAQNGSTVRPTKQTSISAPSITVTPMQKI